jgi:hypothetical protein
MPVWRVPAESIRTLPLKRRLVPAMNSSEQELARMEASLHTALRRSNSETPRKQPQLVFLASQDTPLPVDRMDNHDSLLRPDRAMLESQQLHLEPAAARACWFVVSPRASAPAYARDAQRFRPACDGQRYPGHEIRQSHVRPRAGAIASARERAGACSIAAPMVDR